MEQIQKNSSAPNSTMRQSGIGAADALEVSVIIPAYNAADTIIRAIDSVRSQNMTSLEVIIIDDGSVDGTPEIVTSNIRAGENIQLIRMAKNSGVSAARNAGIRVAKGKFLAFLDADDIWLPEKLRKQIQVIQQDPAITLVSCNSQLIAESGLPVKEGHLNRPPVEGPDAWKTLLVYNFLPTPTVLTLTSLVKEIGGFDESLAVGEDLDLWIKLGLRGKIIVLKEILTNYYDRAGSLMKRHEGQTGHIVVPMLEKHIAEQSHKLSAMEIRYIRGYQSFQMGCNLYFSGSFIACIPIFLKASFYGSRPIKSLLYIPRAICMEFVTKTKQAIVSVVK
jgi:glycosyltransferase involved in cell wall biosynthesis